MSVSVDFERGPRDEGGEFVFNQERLERDFVLTQRVQAGYTPPSDPNPDTGQFRIIDGALDADAQEALSELWGHFQPAACKIANKHRGIVAEIPAIEVSDLETEAFWGLYHSAVKWNPAKNVTFLTHTSNLMLRYMWRYLDTHATNVRVPANTRADIRKANRLLWRLYQGEEHLPRRERLAAAMSISLKSADVILNAEAITHQMGSLDNGYFSDDRDKHSIHGVREDHWKPIDPAATEQRAVDESLLLQDLQSLTRELVSSSGLTDIEREIIRLRYLKRHTLEDVGEVFGVTRERIRVIESRALGKLRHPQRTKRIRGLLEDVEF